PRWPGIGSSYPSKDIPVRMIADQKIDPAILSEARSALSRTEIGVLPRVSVAMALNESLAGLCFPGLNDQIDFGAGFIGTDPSFIAWCTDLFQEYWSKSRKIDSLSEL
ncbi:hypothetical protein J2P12_09185, partial [Candidatus Bathyarchaeota archaeon]|nr:hypothetical protein [Candidatus Bathyarchaeota archaeon]